MEYEKYLHNGINLLKKGEFLDAINNFEEYLINDHSNPTCYYYLGLTYIFRNLYDEAYNYIIKAYKLNDTDVNIVHALAFLNLKYNKVEEAINYLLDLLDIDKNNYLAKRSLDKIRRTKNIDKLIKLASADEFINFKLKKKFSFRLSKISIVKYIIPGVSLMIILSLVLIISNKKILNHKEKKLYHTIDVKDIENIELPDIESDYMVDPNIKKSILKLNPAEIKSLFYETKKLMKKQQYNKALFNINKVLHSNSSIEVKEKFKVLSQFIPLRESFTLKDNITYSELINMPLFYEGAQVVWQGKVEDLTIDKERTTFNFIVKENNKAVGIVKVLFKQAFYNLKNSMNITVSAKYLKIESESRYPFLLGIGIKQE